MPGTSMDGKVQCHSMVVHSIKPENLDYVDVALPVLLDVIEF